MFPVSNISDTPIGRTCVLVLPEGIVMPKLRAIPQPLPLAKMAYEALRNSILTGELQPGEVRMNPEFGWS